MKLLFLINKLKIKINDCGLLNTMIGIIKSFVLYRILHIFFHFDKWHMNAIYNITPYKKEVVKIINEIRPKFVIEIGCGLGEIISRIKAYKKE